MKGLFKGCVTIIGAFIMFIIIIGVIASDDKQTNSGSGSISSVTKQDLLSGFTQGWKKTTLRDVTYYLYDPQKQILVRCEKRSADSYIEWKCTGDLKTGLHFVYDDGTISDSYYIIKQIGNSSYVVDCGADGSYDEYDRYTLGANDGIRYLRKTSYIQDHQ